MKKVLSLIILVVTIFNQVQSARIISSFEIARWFLDSDLVLICSVNKIETNTISRHDSIVENGYHLKYETIREKYIISTDIIIKGEKLITNEMDSVFTPVFPSSAIQEKKEFNGYDSKGDSSFICHMTISDNFYDDSYFRIRSLLNKYLMILQKTEVGYIINYAHNCEPWLLDLIQEVKIKGENYFHFPDSGIMRNDSLSMIQSHQ